MRIKDDDGNYVRDGDQVHFSYGIPPVGVTAEVVMRHGVLWVLTPEHNPKKLKLSQLRKTVGSFYRVLQR